VRFGREANPRRFWMSDRLGSCDRESKTPWPVHFMDVAPAWARSGYSCCAFSVVIIVLLKIYRPPSAFQIAWKA